MRFSEIELLALSEVIDFLGYTYTLTPVATDPSLSIDENFYNDIVMTDKPTFEEMVAAKAVYEQTLKDARMDELRAMTRGKHLQVIYKTGLVYTEAPALYESYIQSDNEVEILKLVTGVEEIEAEELESSTIEYGKKVEEICLNTLHYVTGLNAAKNLDATQIDTLQTNFADVEKALRDSRPAKALGLISAITADGTLITEMDKTKVVGYLTKKLTPS